MAQLSPSRGVSAPRNQVSKEKLMSSKIHRGVLSLCPVAGWGLLGFEGILGMVTDPVLGRRQLESPRKVRRRVHGPASVLTRNIGDIGSSWLRPCFWAELETLVMGDINPPRAAGSEGTESPTALSYSRFAPQNQNLTPPKAAEPLGGVWKGGGGGGITPALAPSP